MSLLKFSEHWSLRTRLSLVAVLALLHFTDLGRDGRAAMAVMVGSAGILAVGVVVLFAVQPAQRRVMLACKGRLGPSVAIGFGIGAGMVVGSAATSRSTDIFQEGIQFRTVKLHQGGEPVADIYRMIEFNTRFPVVVLGDVASQLGGCLLGRDLYRAMLDQYGPAVVSQAVELLWQQSEKLARDIVRAMPDGTYHAYAELDDDEQREHPLERGVVDLRDRRPLRLM